MKIIVYSRERCAPCATLKYWLDKKGIDYELREPDASVWIVPTVVVDDERIEGLDFSRLARLLPIPA